MQVRSITERGEQAMAAGENQKALKYFNKALDLFEDDVDNDSSERHRRRGGVCRHRFSQLRAVDWGFAHDCACSDQEWGDTSRQASSTTSRRSTTWWRCRRSECDAPPRLVHRWSPDLPPRLAPPDPTLGAVFDR
eukprot:COSAG01_NODE_254_length_20214_cov_25.086254_7_plen_135_part_00